MTKKYEGSVYVGVVGGESENGECRDSINNLILRTGDSLPYFIRATKGFEARQMHINKFMESGLDFILLLDHDMIFPEDALERLRSHGLPFVSGYYLRRRYAPMLPIWFKPGDINDPWFDWWVDIPEPNKLYHIGASGWGCMLIHRDVITATREILKGEQEILEDDMDIYPYDLQVIMSAINTLKKADVLSLNQVKEQVDVLAREFKPLTGRKVEITGSDVRFPFFARQAGFDLYGDSGVQCRHMLNYPLHPSDYAAGMNEEQLEHYRVELAQQSNEQRQKNMAAVEKLVTT